MSLKSRQPSAVSHQPLWAAGAGALLTGGEFIRDHIRDVSTLTLLLAKLTADG
jgi:hypothetical protein